MHAEDAGGAKPDSESKTKGRILVVDDEEHLLVTVRDLLEFSGFAVYLARSAEEALVNLREVNPDLVILDISMPGMGGLGFLNVIRETHPGFRGRILILTARANMRDFFQNVPGVDGFLAKPCRKDTLLETVRTLLARSPRPEPVTSKGTGERRILIGEDDSRLCGQLRDSFERAGFVVRIATSGAELIQLAPVWKPHAVVFDISLKDMTAEAVVAILKTMPTTRTIPVVLYDPALGEVAPETRRKPVAAADRYLRTSSGEMLVAVIRELLPA
ncbi:MAG: response regulator [Kiritimatiellae bacterium]|nr:response regulator [Kiritimatiellia bacterium]